LSWTWTSPENWRLWTLWAPTRAILPPGRSKRLPINSQTSQTRLVGFHH